MSAGLRRPNADEAKKTNRQIGKYDDQRSQPAARTGLQATYASRRPAWGAPRRRGDDGRVNDGQIIETQTDATMATTVPMVAVTARPRQLTRSLQAAILAVAGAARTPREAGEIRRVANPRSLPAGHGGLRQRPH